jgi:3-hydroxybutyryl-CoA dehydrogenase
LFANILCLKILAIGEDQRLKELKQKIGSEHEVTYAEDITETPALSLFDLIIDLNLDDTAHLLKSYSDLSGKMIIVCAVKVSLAEYHFMMNHSVKCILIGMNLLPTFIGRSISEISFFKPADEELFRTFMKPLEWNYLRVQDRVGMVTPRVISMIINEACFTLQEGTASILDIEKAMRLGTNYSYGPFEWCNRIGIRNVYETLLSIYKDTHDPRYKICPLLHDKYLRNELFITTSN